MKYRFFFHSHPRAIIFLWSFCLLFFTSCSSLNGIRRSEPQVLDVPFYARGSDEEPKKRLLVLPFIDQNHDRSRPAAEAARTAIVQDLVKTRQFVVLKNTDFPYDLKQAMNEKNEYDLEKISRQSAHFGVSAVLEGKIIDVSTRKVEDPVGLFRKQRVEVNASVRFRIYNTKNGKEIFNETRQALVESETMQVARLPASLYDQKEEDPQLIKEGVIRAFYNVLGFVIKSIEKINWEGRVAKVTGEKIYLNAGRISGLQIGDILKITEDMEEIFDPETGKFIGASAGRVKGTVEVTSYFGNDGSIAIIHSGSGIRENDRVELY